MRLPLEIVRLVISQAEKQFTLAQLFKLRLANRTFDEEVLYVVFTGRCRSNDEPCVINQKSWDGLPWSLQRKYLSFKVQMYNAEPSIFAYLFQPVLEEEMRAREISADDNEAKSGLTTELLRIPMHQKDLVWIVAHESTDFDNLKNNHFSKASNPWGQGWREKQVNEDCAFARICFTMLGPDSSSFLEVARSRDVSVDRENLTFGTSLLKFAIAYASIDVIAMVIERTKCLVPKIDFSNKREIVNLLRIAASRLNACSGFVGQVLASIMQQVPGDLHFSLLGSLYCLGADNTYISIALALWERMNLGEPYSISKKQEILTSMLESAVRSGHFQLAYLLGDEVHRHGQSIYPKAPFAIFKKAVDTSIEQTSGNNRPVQQMHVIRVLLEKGADPNRRMFDAADSKAPLHIVAASDKENAPELLGALIDQGADPNLPSRERPWLPPLFVAAQHGRLVNVEFLLKRDADPRGVYDGKTLLEVADGGIRAELKVLLLKYRWRVDEVMEEPGSREHIGTVYQGLLLRQPLDRYFYRERMNLSD
ncbi:hypothetical protein BDV95DRAFT_609464 [Massariosphaeria phaeospora]|uniref:Uncharacterized protein n=1 Tax=Massariosphaeria phaeospora TaxID=100035 RepID=A0A7C8I2L5_9PLEO|nr:hypothetical protein BDV95DRAFT_609464 [Massariosphaeria phaeospora]